MNAIRTLALTTVGAALLLAGCAAPAPQRAASADLPAAPTVTVRGLGEHFDTVNGPAKLIRVHDEFRLILCVQDGPITGCYADLGHLPRDAALTTWFEMESAPGLKLAMITPERVAVVQDDRAPRTAPVGTCEGER